jgi:hypothetical protein
MGQPLDEMLKIGSEVRVPVATAQLVQFHFTDPIDLTSSPRRCAIQDSPARCSSS